LHHVLESLDHPFYVIDADDYTVLVANSAAKKAFKAGATKCYVLAHARDRLCDEIEHQCPVKTVKRSKRPFTIDHLHYDSKGNPRHDEVHAYPILNARGEVAQVLVYALDITARKQAEQRLEQKTIEAGQRTKELESLIQMVAHDLKSPAIAISGMARRLKNTPPGDPCPEREQMLEQLSAAGNKIESFLKNLLDGLELQSHEPKREAVRLDRIILEAANAHRPVADERGTELLIEVPGSVPEVLGEELRLRQVLDNLILNALNHMGVPARPCVSVQMLTLEDSLFIRVSDNGVGIPPELHDKIFERFFRGPQSGGQQGSGLGLYIVKKIIEGHGGAVWVESRVGHGSAFCFTLPLAGSL
jgi:signal transduction histidine kinase